MHSKIIDPGRHGRFVFANQGSCSKTVSYLGHEARERGRETTFFNQDRNDVTADEVRDSIDSNAKGLRKQQEKFYSLVLSPSEAELRHIGNDPVKLQVYTRQTMDNYAQNATLRDGSKLTPSELVWFATIHEQRTEKEGELKGATKPGLHQHVHVLISAQDRSREHRINPKGRKGRFTFKDWQVENGKTFQRMFGYQEATTSDKLTAGMPEETQQRHRERIRYRIDQLNQYFVGSQKIAIDRALAIGKEKEYGKGFFFNLHRLTKQYQEGKIVNNPYQVLETGKDEKISFPERTLLHLGKGAQGMSQEAGEEEDSSKRKKQRQRSTQLER
jgi:hypothetical protein